MLGQTQNEAFNATIWQRCPKERYFSAKSVNIALSSASMTWNIAKFAQSKFLTALNMTTFPNTIHGIERKDKTRIEKAKRAMKQ